MKIKKTITAGVAMAVTAVALAAPGMVFATNTFSYTAINGKAASAADAFKFDKNLTMDANACVPAATFSFSISPISQGIAGTSTTAEVKPGPAGATIANVVFTTNNSDNSATVTTSGTTKTANKKATVDMSACSFTEPGVYRYIITESGTNNGVTNDSQLKRTLDVYVEDNGSGVLQIASYVLYTGEKTTAPAKAASTPTDKSTGYTNTYTTYDLTFGKEVKGNFGSKDKYFEYTVTLTGITQGTVLTVDVTNADATPHASDATTVTTAANPTSLTAGASGIAQKFYLHDGQYITIKDVPANTTYSVTEASEDYTSAQGIVAADNADGVAHTGAVSGTLTADVKTGYTNTRETTTPTGIFTPGITAGIIIAAGAAAGIVSYAVVKTRKNRE